MGFDAWMVRNHKKVILGVKILFIAVAFSMLAASLPLILSWRFPPWYRPVVGALSYGLTGALGLAILVGWGWGVSGPRRR